MTDRQAEAMVLDALEALHTTDDDETAERALDALESVEAYFNASDESRHIDAALNKVRNMEVRV